MDNLNPDESPSANRPASRRRWPRIIGLLLIVLAPIAASLLYAGAAAGLPLERLGVRGDNTPAPDFTLPGLYGGDLSLTSYRGHPVILNFWASWCAPCRAEAPAVQRVWDQYRDQGVVFLGVNSSDNDTAARAYLTEYGITYPNVRDEAGAVAPLYHADSLPTTILIDREGRIVGRRVGAVPEQWLAARIEDMLK
ncbi:MAG: TlpA disulfide reductase family protein [Anaerolineae bacterium]